MDQLRSRFAAYIRTLQKRDWALLSPFGLRYMEAYYSFSVNRSFLDAVIQFWDHIDNVFCFNNCELCPLFEEFSAILNIPCPMGVEIAIPEPEILDFEALGLAFGLDFSRFSGLMTTPDGLDLDAVLTLCISTPAIATCWAPLMSLLLMSCYLCESPSTICSYRLASVIPQMATGASPAALILAETLIYLDSVHSSRPTETGGSMILLQIWLMEKLKISRVPKNIDQYHPGLLRTRGLAIRDFSSRSSDDWMVWLLTITEDQITWTCPWWRIPCVITFIWAEGVQLIGLHRISFYFPPRVRRQFGVPQTIVEVRSHTTCVPWDARWRNHIKSKWMSARTYETLDYSRSLPIDTDESYKEWILAIHALDSRDDRRREAHWRLLGKSGPF